MNIMQSPSAGVGAELSMSEPMPVRYFNTKAVTEMYAISRQTLWRRIKDGGFPEPVEKGYSNKWARWQLEQFEQSKMVVA